MPQNVARLLLALFLVALFVGTLMPGDWKVRASQPFAPVLDLAVWAHVCLFAVICFLLPFAGLWRVRLWQLPLLGLSLALVTEGLQFFAVNRHPNLAGVLQDLAGACIGWALAQAALRYRPAVQRARVTRP